MPVGAPLLRVAAARHPLKVVQDPCGHGMARGNFSQRGTVGAAVIVGATGGDKAVTASRGFEERDIIGVLRSVVDLQAHKAERFGGAQ